MRSSQPLRVTQETRRHSAIEKRRFGEAELLRLKLKMVPSMSLFAVKERGGKGEARLQFADVGM